MSDFTTPFGSLGEKRLPTPVERQQGFLCGPADRQLFNGLLHRLESELGTVMDYAGTAQTDGSFDGLLLAILELISAATGGGDPSGYLTLLQASARLPIYPEVTNANGHLGIITPATSQVRVPAGVTFLHRGISPITTVLTDFALDPSKVYHLRWNKTDGFSIKDLGSISYNPGGLAETHPSFDSTFDDVLFARVITNSSGVVTVTNLVNRDRIFFTGDLQIASTSRNGTDSTPVTINSARTLQVATKHTIAIQDGVPNDEIDTGVVSLSRYQIGLFYRRNIVLGDGCRIGYTAWG